MSAKDHRLAEASGSRAMQDPCDILPGYEDYVSQLTPEQFIEMFWNVASDDMRGYMIEYINEYPFDGSLRYIAEWMGYLGRIYGQLI